MSGELIKEKAYDLFAEKGYEGTSMSLIAEHVGIKKASIYSHFKGKKELYLQLYHEALEKELAFIQSFFSTEDVIEKQLYDFLLSSIERFETDRELHFLLRQGFFPPAGLKDEMIKIFNQYVVMMEGRLESMLQEVVNEGKIDTDPKMASVAYVALLDSVYVELMYGEKKKAILRAESTWNLLWKGMSSK
ncbi:TetR/AcrR family transcriptional regulator [Bacillus kexueae]|uniref:TetR/AcrR family transcriptional regulator n=1 Tax=Aeribacillus kexueae TaxID=2078952 RepID=UPI001FAE86E6|nr:TetR/AcrR family transcriptional regulator [Bacillus kexueae]